MTPNPQPKAREVQISLIKWGKKNWRSFPWRRTAGPYDVMVAEVMLQQTRASKVVNVYQAFRAAYPSFQKLAHSSLKEVEALIRPLGLLYRAKLLREIALAVVKQFDGKLPATKELLRQLPGVGEYISSAVACFALGQRCAILDTTILRAYQRVFKGINPAKQPWVTKELHSLAQLILPKTNVAKFNQYLLDFAALICTAKNPKCADCPINTICCFYNRNQAP